MAIIARSFLGVALPAAANLATAPRGVGLEGRPPRVGEDPGGGTGAARRAAPPAPRFQNPAALALFPAPRLGRLAGVEEIPDQFVPDGRCQAREQLARIFSLLVQSQTDAH